MFGLPKIAIYIVLAMVLLAAGAAIVDQAYKKGWYAGQDALQQAIEKRNREAASHAQEARNALDKCYDSGGEWDQSRGVCKSK